MYSLRTIFSPVFNLVPTTDSENLTEPRWRYHRLCARLQTTCIWSSPTQEPYYPGFSSWPNILRSSMLGWFWWIYSVATTITYVSLYHWIVNFQMRPSYHPRSLNQNYNITSNPITQTWHQKGKCPENTIPIRRTMHGGGCPKGKFYQQVWQEEAQEYSEPQFHKWPWHAKCIKWPRGKKNYSRITMLLIICLFDSYNYFCNCSFNFVFSPMEQHAVAAAQDNKCYGTKASFNLWQPTIARTNDFSLSQLWVTAGSYSGNDLNTIEAGWQVRPEVKT